MLDIDDGIDLINKAFEKREEEKAWSLYASMYPFFTGETFITFDDFYKAPQKVSRKSEGEILADVKNILDGFRR